MLERAPHTDARPVHRRTGRAFRWPVFWWFVWRRFWIDYLYSPFTSLHVVASAATGPQINDIVCGEPSW